jgi:hypothetical protein
MYQMQRQDNIKPFTYGFLRFSAFQFFTLRALGVYPVKQGFDANLSNLIGEELFNDILI